MSDGRQHFPFLLFSFLFVMLLLFEIRSHYTEGTPLELLILLTQSPKCWNYRHDIMCGRKVTFKQSDKDSKLYTIKEGEAVCGGDGAVATPVLQLPCAHRALPVRVRL